MFVGAAGAQTEERADVATLLHDLQHATSWSRQAECARALAATRVPDVEVLAALLRHITTSSVPALAAAGRSVPRFCQRETAAFMRCGILAHGFARVHCDGCGQDDIVAFSCKGRGFCPSCGAARMVDTAAWLVDAVIPEVPVRQWVLSLPYRVRALCAYDPAACALVRSVLVRAVAGFYERTARRAGVPRARGGAVAFVQRFDSALRLNVHFHVLWLDGVYGWEPGRGEPVFHEHAGLCDADVELLVQRIRVRVLRALRKLGKWGDAEDAADGGDEFGEELLPGLVGAAIEGRAALGERAGQRDGRVGQSYAGQQAPRRMGPLCAESAGFSLHAGAWVAARDRERLEKLCRYAGRPAVAESRLVELGGGRIGYSLKKRWRDGTTALVMTQEVLMERLCALVPRRERDARDLGGCRHGEDGGAVAVVSADLDEAVVAAGVDLRRRLAERQRLQRLRVPHGGGRRSGVRRRLPWAALLQRVFGVSALVCPQCAGPRRVLAAIHDPAAIARVLGALGLSGEEPGPVGCRAPPGREEGGEDGESG